jgi:spermidine synthase
MYSEKYSETTVDIVSHGSYKERASSSGDITTNYPYKKKIWHGKTRFCEEVAIVESDEFGLMLFTDGELQSTSSDEAIYHEHLIHPTVSLWRQKWINPSFSARCLVLGGGEGATVRELLRYPASIIREVIWVDIDEELVHLCKEHMGYVSKEDERLIYYNNERCIPYFMDAMKFLQDDTLPFFDIVICDLPDPELNPVKGGLYSELFWKSLFNRCARNATIVTHAGPIQPGSKGTSLAQSVWSRMKEAGFMQNTWGKVFIPSFQSEWAFLIANKSLSQKSPLRLSPFVKNDLRVLDDAKDGALQAFVTIPKYYGLEPNI